MWYDFLFKIEQLAYQIWAGEVEWQSVFNNVIISIFLIVFFTITCTIIMLVNGLASGEIKFAKSLKRMKKFFSVYGVLNTNTILAFNKFCIASMPMKCKKSFQKFYCEPNRKIASGV